MKALDYQMSGLPPHPILAPKYTPQTSRNAAPGDAQTLRVAFAPPRTPVHSRSLQRAPVWGGLDARVRPRALDS